MMTPKNKKRLMTDVAKGIITRKEAEKLIEPEEEETQTRKTKSKEEDKNKWHK